MNPKILLTILVSLVGISGFSQGMLLPIIAIIFEKDGISSSLNGFHATGIYIGVLLTSPLMEAPLRKFGYKPLILIGGLSVIISLALFPVWKSFWFWFLLRLIIGIGDHMLHFATQTWITDISPVAKRGRNIAIYGLFFSLGFMIGPFMSKLLEINEALPFIISSLLSSLTWSMVFFLKNSNPKHEIANSSDSFTGTFKRFAKAMRYAWIAFLPPLAYGVLEAALNGNFSVYALRAGFDLTAVSIIIPAFAGGSLLTQIPLGMLSDKYGRRKLLLFVLFSSMITFTMAVLLNHSVLGLFLCFLIAGMLVGSTFSLGLSYMLDLLPSSLLPTGNLLCGIFYSLGSIIGPFMGGVVIQYFKGGSFFYSISTMLLLIFISFSFFKEKNRETEVV